jgi:predicted RNA-binding Zn-ribbon protein involved in translation (DUF1610 family)
MSSDWRDSHRQCGQCGERVIRRDIDWPYWEHGFPICFRCHVKAIEDSNTTGALQPFRLEQEVRIFRQTCPKCGGDLPPGGRHQCGS